ncbi:MAG: hypothetical protein ACOZQL_25505 [Myxococcota bacterium]
MTPPCSSAETLKLWICGRHIELVRTLGFTTTYNTLRETLSNINTPTPHQDTEAKLRRLPEHNCDDSHKLAYSVGPVIELVRLLVVGRTHNKHDTRTLNEMTKLANTHAFMLEATFRHYSAATIQLHEQELTARATTLLARDPNLAIDSLPSNVDAIIQIGLTLKLHHGTKHTATAIRHRGTNLH